MPQAMERNVLLYISFLKPIFQRIIYHASTESFKYFACSYFSAKFKSLMADGERGFSFSLLSTDANAVALIGSDAKVRPLQVHYVANTKPCQAGK